MEIQWSLVLFAALSAWGAGTYAATAVFGELLGWAPGAKKPCLVLSAAALIVGAIASMTHLGHLDRIFGVLANPGSGIFVEGLSAGLLVVVIAVWLVAASRGASESALKAVAVVGLVLAAVLTVAVGSSYLMASKPAWDVLALPLLSVGTAAVLGCVTYLAVASRGADAKVRSNLSLVVLVAVAVQSVLVILYLAMVAGAGFQHESRAVARVLSGDLAPLFWIGVAVLGLVVPAAAAVVERRGAAADAKVALSGEATSETSAGATTFLFAAVACLVLAAVSFRVVMFSLGSSIISFGF